MVRPKSLKELLDEHNALQPGNKPPKPKGTRVNVIILHPGPYSDYDLPSGHLGANNFAAGDVGSFPPHYATGIVASGLARWLTEDELKTEDELEAERTAVPEPVVIDATLAAVKLATAGKVDLASVEGTGTDGRILVKDVQKALVSGLGREGN